MANFQSFAVLRVGCMDSEKRISIPYRSRTGVILFAQIEGAQSIQ